MRSLLLLERMRRTFGSFSLFLSFASLKVGKWETSMDWGQTGKAYLVH